MENLRLFARLYNIPDEDASAMKWLERVGLDRVANGLVREFSRGMRQRLAVARAFLHDPDVLLLDEPSSGIAQRETEALAPLLQRIRSETGCAMLVIEHDMPLISSLADRLVALDTGTVVTTGLPDDVLHHPRVVEAYLGTAADLL
jgi:branched-chain amino acid transport system ATP-binding protein